MPLVTSPTDTGTRIPRYVPPLILVSVGVAMASWTWKRWLHPFVDFGRELYVPWQLSEGQVLYRDIAFFNGPLSQYWNAMLFELFGVGLQTLVVFNLLLIAAVCFLLYRMVLAISDRLTATIGGAAYLFLFCFGQLESIANFNWVCPYSHEMTHGVALTLAATAALSRWLETGRARPLLVAAVATGLAALTKPEILIGGGVMCVTVLLLARAGDRRPRLGRDTAVFLGAAAAPPVAAFLLLWTALPAAQALRGVLGGWAHVFNQELSANLFYRCCLGIDEPGRRTAFLLTATGIWTSVLGPQIVLTLFLTRRGWARFAVVSAAAALTIVLVPLLLERLWREQDPVWLFVYVPMPLALLAIAWYRVVAWRRAESREQRHGAARGLILAALSLGFMVKMPLFARLHHYGFGLAIPGAMLCVVAMFHWIPRFVRTRGGYDWGVRVAGCGILTVIALGHGSVFARHIERHRHKLGEGVDAFWMDEREPVLERVLEGLRNLPPGETFAVFPEGITLNYLARRPNPTPFINFMPPELIMFGEDAILAALQEKPPGYLVLTARPTAEYGLPMFGTDYAQELGKWIRESYRVIPYAKLGPEPLDPKRAEDHVWAIWVLQKKNG